MNSMTAEERTQILAEIPLDMCKPWRNHIEANADVETLKPPTIGMVMMRATDSVEGQVFNVGEVLVTEAAVSVDGQLGYGIILGNEPEKAEFLAMIDAICHSEDKKWHSFLVRFHQWISRQKAEQEQQRRQDFKLIERTRVQFDLLDEG